MTARDAAKLLIRLPYFFQKPPKSDRLNIGCGANLLTGWINTDYFPGKGITFLNAAKAFPFPVGSMRYVFSEHMIEHIPYCQAVNMLRESFRVLAAGGRIRIATPDAPRIWHLEREPDWDYIHWVASYNSLPPTATQIVNQLNHGWGHKFLWSFQEMERVLAEIGFVDVKTCRPGESDDPVLRGIEGHGKIIGERWNLFETLVVEAVKPAADQTTIP